MKIPLITKILCLIFLLLIENSICLAQTNDTEKYIRANNSLIFDAIPLNLEEVTGSADKIFTGICTGIEEIADDPVSMLQVTQYKFHVLEGIKGVKNNSDIVFKQWQPVSKDSNFEIAKKYILFLYPESKLGLTSPVGYLQGLFKVERTSDTEYVINKLNNVGLATNLRTRKKISLKDKLLEDYISKSAEAGKPIKYREFTRAVRFLVEK